MSQIGKSKLHTMKNTVIAILFAAVLSGCSTFDKPIAVSTVPIEKVPLMVTMPAPLSVSSPKWRVITPNNANEVWAELEKKKQPLVMFAITPDGYESLAITLAEIRNLIQSQREIILLYQEYYKPEN